MEQLPQLSEEEFDQIEEAIARTTKGRAFLRRFHRRAHGAAAEEVRKMLTEFRSSWHQQGEVVEAAKHVEVLRRELMEMAASIEQARREVAALRPPDGGGDKITSATNELDAIVISTERASFEILNAAERLMDLSGKLKADGADPGLCSEIEGEVTNIFTACSFQDLTGQRTSKVVNALRYIEQRVNAMINIWGTEGLAGLKIQPDNTDTRPDAHLLNGPQLDGQGVSQADVDSMFDSPAPAPTPAAAPEPAPAAPAGAQSSQADIDSLFDSPAPAPVQASHADIDSLFDAPAPPPPPPAKKPVPKPPSAASKPVPKPAPKPSAKPAAAPPPAANEPPVPLDQAAIDALFG